MKKVLIIEDDQIVASIYRNKLTAEGFQVEVAHTGETGLELVKSFLPDAVILDLVLPSINGVDLMKIIRAEPGFQSLPLIVFSNTYLANMVQEAWKAGATKCLSKANCSPRQVIDALRSVTNTNGETQPGPVTSQARASLVAPQPEPAKVAEDELFQAELRSSFVKTLPDTLVALRTSVKALAKADSDSTRADHAQVLYRRIHTLTSNANLAGLVVIAHLGEALDALLKELYEKPDTINASTLRTLATAVDFLGYLFSRVATPERQSPTKPNILVVDDEAISRRAITHALERARLKSTSIEDPTVAFKLLTQSEYDLIFLDVDMPGMNGFELCTKIRALPRYKFTPIVFVTSLDDFESRTNSMMSGGNDFIAKPFHFLELAVKALVYILRNKYPAQKRP